MVSSFQTISIGEVSRRTGVATSALRFYESIGLIESKRSEGNQRRFQRSIIRTVAVVKAAQRAGISLDEIKEKLSSLPAGRVPSREDWISLSQSWSQSLESRIAHLKKVKDELSGCIGCGCLSLDTCAMFNPNDELASTLTGTSKLELIEDIASN